MSIEKEINNYIPELDGNIFSVQGIKTYLLMFYKQPLVTIAITFLSLTWKNWQDTGNEISFYGFIAMSIIFIVIIITSNNKSSKIYKETKDATFKINDQKLKLISENSKAFIELSNYNFKMNHISRNTSMLRKLINNETNYLIQSLDNQTIISNPEMLKVIIVGVIEKINDYTSMIDSNASSSALPLKDIHEKMMTGEIKSIPIMELIKNQVENKLDLIKDIEEKI